MSCTLSTQPTRRKGQSVQNRIGRVKTNHFERKNAIFLCEVKRCPKMRSLTKLFQSPMAKNNCQAAMCSNSTRHFEVNLRKLSDFLCHTECPRVHKGRCGHWAMFGFFIDYEYFERKQITVHSMQKLDQSHQRAWSRFLNTFDYNL